MDPRMEDHSEEVLQALRAATLRALEACGIAAEHYASLLAPVDTWQLKNSITHKVDAREKAVYIGTNVEYAAYVELGTGIHYPGGRPTPWAYQDENGNWHSTRGSPPQPYLKPAVTDHQRDYLAIIQRQMNG